MAGAAPDTRQEEQNAKNKSRDPRLDFWPEDERSNKKRAANPLRFVMRQIRNWTFSYMDVVLSRGARQDKEGGSHLTYDDLFPVPQSMKSQHLVNEFDEVYYAESQSEKFTLEIRKGHLNHALWRIAAPTFIPAGFCELAVVLCGTALPLLVRELLSILEENPGSDVLRQGLPLSISIFVVLLLNGLSNHRHRHMALKTGVALRATVVNILYRHILNLSPEGKRGLTSGEVTNLVAVDSQKLFEVTQDGHLIWALPLNILLVSFFLYRTLGPSTLVGIAVLLGFVPVIQHVSARMLAIRQERVKCTDSRVEIVSNMLQGIRVAKLNNYEANYLHRVAEIRNKELKHLSREMAVWATTLLMTVTSPVLATGATFATYVLVDESNLLTASDTFGVLLLFSALRFPINYAGRLIGKAAQALSALNRINKFLDRDLRAQQKATASLSSEDIVSKANGVNSLTFKNARFRIGAPIQRHNGEELDETEGKPPKGFTVSEFNFSIGRGEFIAVCGPVGSGKSTFLGGILKETDVLGNSSVDGNISYVPQTPFVLNQTIRSNILFGLPFDKDRYDKVLDACALLPDLEQLGESGDMTEIGERGVTLSGGQKQRISLARAAYSKAAIYVLDDPFSALDAGTGKAVFERLLASKNALLKGATVLLVTHAPYFIVNRAVDRILLIVDGKNRFFGTWEDLSLFNSQDNDTMRAVDHIKSSIRENGSNSEEKRCDDSQGTDQAEAKTGGALMQVEEREHGLSSLKTWMLWFQRAGGWRFMSLQLLFMAIDRFVYVSVEWFLAKWTSAAYEPIQILGIDFPAQTDGRSAQGRYLWVYLTLIVVSFFATFVRSEWAVTGGGRATRTVFESMLTSVLHAPMSYFETVPMGRILNRFTYDTDVNDVTLTQIMSMVRKTLWISIWHTESYTKF